MEIILSRQARKDINYWKATNNIVIQKKVSALIASISESPFEGLGKPEPLKHNFSGAWSRRIDREHRLIYEIWDGDIHILSMKGHYTP